MCSATNSLYNFLYTHEVDPHRVNTNIPTHYWSVGARIKITLKISLRIEQITNKLQKHSHTSVRPHQNRPRTSLLNGSGFGRTLHMVSYVCVHGRHVCLNIKYLFTFSFWKFCISCRDRLHCVGYSFKWTLESVSEI